MNSTSKLYIGATLFLLLICVLTISSLFLSLDPLSTHLLEKNSPPSLSHWFGTDELGRDFFSRTIQGLKISLAVGLSAFIIDLTIGVFWGTLSAFSPPYIDSLLTRIAGLLYSIHPIVIGIIFSLFFGFGFFSILLSLACVGWIQVAHTTRILVTSALSSEYVLSSKAIGTPPFRLFFKHILPNIIGPILSASMLSIPQAIFTEASLSFLGIGIQPPYASLGSIINDSLPSLRFFPWKLCFPISLLSLLVFSIILLIDGLCAQYDPKRKLAEASFE